MDPISAGIAAAASLFKGVTGFFQGQAKAKAEKLAADQASAEAGVAASQALGQGDAVAAQGAVNAAANGGGFVGSSLAAISQLSAKAMFNARAAAYRGATERQTHLYNAKVAKAQGLSDLIGSLSPAGGALYGGVARSEANSTVAASLASQSAAAGASGASLDDLAGLY